MRYIYVNIQSLSHANNIIGRSNYLGDNEVYLCKCTVITIVKLSLLSIFIRKIAKDSAVCIKYNF